LRFHFTSDKSGYSDEDGLLNTDGACIVDSIRVSDTGGFSNYENFEGAAVGARSAGIWHGKTGPAFGTYSGLKASMSVGDRDPCGVNFSTQIVFFIGSPVPSTTYPGLFDTPFCEGIGGHTVPCQDELVYSPVIDLTKYSTAHNSVQDAPIPPGDLPHLGGCELRYAQYIDNSLTNLVLWQWKIRNIDASGCPGQWVDFNFIYYYWSTGYNFFDEDIGSLITASKIQVAVGIIDMCDVWYLVNGNCAQHTPAPWYDNVRLYRWVSNGPQWSYRELDLFQDNFPGNEFNIESYVRADAANDINTNDNPVNRPGDSIVVDCTSALGGGIAADPAGGPAVYMHVKCSYIGPAPAKPSLHGPSLQGTYGRYKSDNGVWAIIQGDTARARGHVTLNKYMFDLNDSLFTRGYEIEYYFTALNNSGAESALPEWARSRGPYFEFTCLPTKNSDVLFVNDSDDRGGGWRGGVESYWRQAFYAVLAPPNSSVDIYHVNGPTSGVSNGPGSRAKNKQLTDQYDAIVWDSGDLNAITISDGTWHSDKSNDCQMLTDWMDLSEHTCGLWICGDGVAYNLTIDASTSALTLMHTKCGVTLVNDSYYELTGGRTGSGIINPLITGDANAGIFVHTGVPDKFYAFGGCPVINLFDVLGETANGQYALRYPTYGGTNYYAGIASSWTNGAGENIRTMWFGFSFEYIRDDRMGEPIDRFEIATDVFKWMQLTVNGGIVCCAGAETPAAYNLAQNFPNPFNPSTTIKYDMKERGLVRIKIYDVAGELVRTVVDGVKDAGAYSIAWDGRNNTGAGVASGIYFYMMETKDFSRTRKMVMLR
ncbi:MAG: FlgD immunoglobulin-like domain containing protein, partial [Candidatus Krumholzibacteriaceae bacterium]